MPYIYYLPRKVTEITNIAFKKTASGWWIKPEIRNLKPGTDVKVQVLKNGTMFPFRAAKLYCKHDSLTDIPEKQGFFPAL